MAAAATPVPSAPRALAQDPSCALPFSDYQLPEETPVYSAYHLRVRQDRARRLKASARTRQRNNAKPARRASLAPSALGATLQPSPTQAVHRIFFAVALGRKYPTPRLARLRLRPLVHLAHALKALIVNGAPVDERPCGVQPRRLVRLQEPGHQRVAVSMKIGRQEETVTLLVVDELDYDLVSATTSSSTRSTRHHPGRQHTIALKDSSKVPYCTSVDPVRPDATAASPSWSPSITSSQPTPCRTSASSYRPSRRTTPSSCTTSASSTQTTS